MKIFFEGDQSLAFCHNCAATSPTTFKFRDVEFSDGSGFANILAGVCDGCGVTVSIPPQSTPAIKHALENSKPPLEDADDH